MDRSVIHLNVADFAVAVERRMDARLRDRPVIIAPEGAARAAVYDMSEEAYQAGVRKGAPLREAVRVCRDARVIPPHPARYEQAMGDLIRRAAPYSPLIEPGCGDGHLFMDVTGVGRLFGPPMDVAWRIRGQARKDLGLDPIWSVGPNKLVAKVATRLVKPTGEYIVAAGEEEAFLAPLSLELIPGIEAADLARLRDFNLTRVSQVLCLSLEQLAVPFGRRAGYLYEAVRGRDASPVTPLGQAPPAVVADHEFGTDVNCASALEATLYAMTETAGNRLRRRCMAAGNVAVTLDYSDGVRRIRQRAVKPAAADDQTLFEFARSAFYLAWNRRVRVRHIRLACGPLTFPPAQLPLFPEPRQQAEKRASLMAAMDKIRRRYGWDAVRFCRTAAQAC